MVVYIDSEYKCHTEAADGLTAVDTDYFAGKCRTFIEGYRFVPAGQSWTRGDGRAFFGEMVAPWKDYATLAAAQAGYEESLERMADMQEALDVLGVSE